jgi:hypothetical protein
LFWLFTGLQLFIVVLIAVIYAVVFGVIFSQTPTRPGDPPPEVIIPFVIIILAIVVGVLLLFSIPKIVAGYGLRKEKPWARVWAIVACVLACMSFPLGTAVGVYGLIFLLGEQGKQYFNLLEYGGLAPNALNPPPPPNSWQ